MTQRRKWIFRAVLTAAVGAVLLMLAVGAEVALRYFRGRQLDERISALERLVTSNVRYNRTLFAGYAGREEEAQAHFDADRNTRAIHRPFIEYRRPPNYHKSGINTNSLSYRGPEFSVTKPKGVFRILLYGGSFVWGTGALRDEETISGHLERMLNADPSTGLRYEVINCGETGFQTTQEIVFLTIEGVYLQPDLVIFLDGVNDSSMGHSNLPAGYPKTFDRFNELLTGAARAYDDKMFTLDNELQYLKKIRSTLWSGRSSQIWKLLDEKVSLPEGEQRLDDAQSALRVEEFALRHSQNLRIAKALSKEYGFSLVAAIQPIPMFYKPLHAHEQQAIEAVKKSRLYFDMEDWWSKHYLNYTDRVITEAGQQDIRMVDLRRIFEGNAAPLYTDNVHMTGDGYRVVAESMRKYLVESGLLAKKN